MTSAMAMIAVILGLVEGMTEFLPVSSTGHLIVAGSLLDFAGERAATFEIVIQVGAILAVVWHYRALLRDLVARMLRAGRERGMAINLVIAFMPAALVGVALHHWIKLHLFTPTTVAMALIVGGVLILLIERVVPAGGVTDVGTVSVRQAFAIGCAQVLSLIPGTSRAAATILGGYSAGLSRPAATEFSFLLAIPTLIAAAGYDGYKSRALFVRGDLPFFAIGTIVSFIVALVVIRVFLRFVQSHSFRAFAWYRIAFGALILALAAMHLLHLNAA